MTSRFKSFVAETTEPVVEYWEHLLDSSDRIPNQIIVMDGAGNEHRDYFGTARSDFTEAKKGAILSAIEKVGFEPDRFVFAFSNLLKNEDGEAVRSLPVLHVMNDSGNAYVNVQFFLEHESRVAHVEQVPEKLISGMREIAMSVIEEWIENGESESIELDLEELDLEEIEEKIEEGQPVKVEDVTKKQKEELKSYFLVELGHTVRSERTGSGLYNVEIRSQDNTSEKPLKGKMNWVAPVVLDVQRNNEHVLEAILKTPEHASTGINPDGTDSDVYRQIFRKNADGFTVQTQDVEPDTHEPTNEKMTLYRDIPEDKVWTEFDVMLKAIHDYEPVGLIDCDSRDVEQTTRFTAI